MSRLDKRIVALLKIEMFTKSGLEYSDLSKEEILKVKIDLRKNFTRR